MEYTQNYHLPQWVETDRLLMDDFNAMTSAIDTALDGHDTGLSGLQTQVSAKGDCFIVAGTYTGTGENGEAYPNTLTFDKKPLLVAVLPTSHVDSSVKQMVMVRGSGVVWTYATDPNSRCTVTWTDNSVSWYSNAYPSNQFNTRTTHNYVALLAAD